MDFFFICSSYHCITAAYISVMFHLITWMGMVLEPVIESQSCRMGLQRRDMGNAFTMPVSCLLTLVTITYVTVIIASFSNSLCFQLNVNSWLYLKVDMLNIPRRVAALVLLNIGGCLPVCMM